MWGEGVPQRAKRPLGRGDGTGWEIWKQEVIVKKKKKKRKISKTTFTSIFTYRPYQAPCRRMPRVMVNRTNGKKTKDTNTN